ncbi:MAG: phosphatase PAP2 family protein [Kibdelosporangium sp.]
MIRLSVVGGALLVVFLLLGYLVRSSVTSIDAVVSEALGGFWQQPASSFVFVLTDILGPVLPIVVLVILVVACLRAWRSGQRKLADLLLRSIVLLATCRAVSLFKDVYGRERPRVYAADWSYPSGHVVSVSSVAFTGVVLCAWLARHLLRRAIVLAVAVVAVAAACRVLLDVHWVTDVLGGVVGVTGIGLVVASALKLIPVGERRVSG